MMPTALPFSISKETSLSAQNSSREPLVWVLFWPNRRRYLAFSARTSRRLCSAGLLLVAKQVLLAEAFDFDRNVRHSPLITSAKARSVLRKYQTHRGDQDDQGERNEKPGQ